MTTMTADHTFGQKIRSTLIASRKRKIVAALLCLVLLPSAAVAAWLLTTEGPGAASIGRLETPTVEAGTPINRMYPGQTGDAVIKVTNNNDALVITSVMPGSGGGSSSDPGGCPTGHMTVNTLSSVSIPVPNGTSEIAIPNAFTLSSGAPNGCQGATMQKPLRVTFSTP